MSKSTEVKFDCGCKFVNEVNAVFGLCPMHEAAPDLLAALEAAALAGEHSGSCPRSGPVVQTKHCNCYLAKARAAIARAKP